MKLYKRSGTNLVLSIKNLSAVLYEFVQTVILLFTCIVARIKCDIVRTGASRLILVARDGVVIVCVLRILWRKRTK